MLNNLLMTYGYPLIFLGTFFEGETIMILGAFAAHRGYLNIELVMLAGFLGTLFGDQLWFWVGRRHGKEWLMRKPDRAHRVQRVQRLLERHSTLIIVGFRFLYGLRTITPLALGASDVDWRKFAILNVIGAFVWAVAIGWLGFAFSSVAETVLGEAKRYEVALTGIIFGTGFLVWLRWWIKKRRSARLSKSVSVETKNS